MGRIWIHTSRTVQSDDHHNDIDSKTFYEWFEEALNHLPLNSAVVLDNASKLKKRAPGTPTYATKKADIKDWLIKKIIDFPPRALKSELWEIIKQYLKQCPEYDVDKMLNNVHDVQAIAHTAFQNVMVDMVRNCINHVKKQEKLYCLLHNMEPLNF